VTCCRQIAQLHAVAPVDDEVLALNVSVDDRLFVQVLDGADHVPEVLPRDGLRQEAARPHAQQLLEVSILAKLHNET